MKIKSLSAFAAICSLALLAQGLFADESILKVSKAEASSVLNNDPAFAAEKAIDDDGDNPTRWQSKKSDKEWISFDLGAEKTVSGIDILWAEQYATEYKVQVSTDGKAWLDAFVEKNGDGARDSVRFSSPQTARYLKIVGLKSANDDGYAIWNVAVIAPK